jgi:hypothetical protein
MMKISSDVDLIVDLTIQASVIFPTEEDGAGKMAARPSRNCREGLDFNHHSRLHMKSNANALPLRFDPIQER